MVACRGFVRRANSLYVADYANMITCITCLGTNWEATVAALERLGRLTLVQDLDKDGELHRILMEGKALAESALQPSPASRWR
jgi:hypothetical protein